MPQQTRLQQTKQENLGSSQDYITRADFEKILDDKLNGLKEDLATKECIQQLLAVIGAQNSKIEELESKIVVMERYIAQLQRSTDDQEQYQRRLCLRINGVEVTPGKEETGQDCLEKCKKIFKSIGVKVPDTVLDRAHRIGKTKAASNGKTYRQIIVRFATWRHRTMVYKARKKSQTHKIRLDLTKKRMNVIQKTNEILESRRMEGCFTFADINCHLCARINDAFHYFDDEDDFMKLLDRISGGEKEDMEENAEDGSNESGEDDDEEEEDVAE